MKPSDYLRVEDPVLAYYFDRAVWLFGGSVEADLDAIESNAKGKANPKTIATRKQMVLNKWMPSQGGTTRGRFRDPALRKG